MTKIKSYTMKFKGQRERQKEYLLKKQSIEALHKNVKDKPVNKTQLYAELEQIWSRRHIKY